MGLYASVMKCTVDGNFEAIDQETRRSRRSGRPGRRFQDLCAQHFHSVRPLGGLCVVEVYQSPWIEHFKLETCPSDHCAEESS